MSMLPVTKSASLLAKKALKVKSATAAMATMVVLAALNPSTRGRNTCMIFLLRFRAGMQDKRKTCWMKKINDSINKSSGHIFIIVSWYDSHGAITINRRNVCYSSETDRWKLFTDVIIDYLWIVAVSIDQMIDTMSVRINVCICIWNNARVMEYIEYRSEI